MTQDFVPGDFVRHPGQPDWGIGQVQSMANGRATVNFEHAGKRTIVLAVVALVAAAPLDDVSMHAARRQTRDEND